MELLPLRQLPGGTMSDKKFMDILMPQIKNMMGAGRLEPEVYAQLTHIIQTSFDTWSQETAQDLTQKAKDWEDTMGPEKEGFYSLGLRRSADFILGKNSTENPNPEAEK